MSSAFAAAMDKIVADCNDRLLWVDFSKNHLTKEAARVLVQQWSNFTRHSRQCWAHVVGNCPHVEVRKFIVTENLYEEEAQEGHSHFEILARMGMALGLTRDEIVNAKPLPTTVVTMRCWEALTKDRTWYEGLAAKSVLERTNAPHCGNFSHHQDEHWTTPARPFKRRHGILVDARFDRPDPRRRLAELAGKIFNYRRGEAGGALRGGRVDDGVAGLF